MRLFLVLLLSLLPCVSLGHNPAWLDSAMRYNGIAEKPGNRGVADVFNRYVGVPLGSYYCASAASYWLYVGKAPLQVKTARARAFVLPFSVRSELVVAGRYTPKPGDIVVWTRNGGGHVGFVRWWQFSSGATIEANTSPNSKFGGSQHNGGGIYARSRRIVPGAAFRITHFTPVQSN